jgi:hypothetical protein
MPKYFSFIYSRGWSASKSFNTRVCLASSILAGASCHRRSLPIFRVAYDAPSPTRSGPWWPLAADLGGLDQVRNLECATGAERGHQFLARQVAQRSEWFNAFDARIEEDFLAVAMGQLSARARCEHLPREVDAGPNAELFGV